jgi:GNAT superfamily N-acetyltransferase
LKKVLNLRESIVQTNRLGKLEVVELTAVQWQRYRKIRIASLKSDPDAFGANVEKTEAETQSDWELRFEKVVPIVAVAEGIDSGILTIENLSGDFGATCWIGGCWVDPEVRGRGVMRAMFNHLDLHALERDWKVQGLGVWQDNHAAIAVYESLGFESKGDPVPSTSKPGLFYQRMIRNAVTN